MFLPKQYAHLTGVLSAFAARMAAAADLPPEQLRLEVKRSARPPKVRPRWQRPAPRQSRQYGMATPTTIDRDQRITSGAVRLAHLLVALAGRGDIVETERWRLAKRLGVSVRTISRHLSDLRGDEVTGRTSYIQTEHIIDEYGMTTGLCITILPALRPYWIQEEQGVTDVSSKESLIKIGNLPARVIHRAAGIEDDFRLTRVSNSCLQDHRAPRLLGMKVLNL